MLSREFTRSKRGGRDAWYVGMGMSTREVVFLSSENKETAVRFEDRWSTCSVLPSVL